MWEVSKSAGLLTIDSMRLTDASLGGVFRDHEVDVFLNVYSLVVVDAQVLRAPRLGSFNVHPGPLPAYAGLHSVSWAIYNGERTHGVTLHHMEARVDAGAIVFQETFPITEIDTGLTISSKCARIGVQLVIRLLGALEQDPGLLPRIEQDLRVRSYFGATVPRGGRLDWDSPAAGIVDFVRACDYYPLPSPWDLPTAFLGGREIDIAKAARTNRLTNAPPGTIRVNHGSMVQVASADEWISVIQVRSDGRRCSPVAVLEPGSEGVSRRAR
jgi:UDP-4-amino-4-deoxy-L-arabinose formyltransferase/UDP-glucuronic acid dehydrogenase (UDP-4-keto-hexauronic acid decarboxylating)